MNSKTKRLAFSLMMTIGAAMAADAAAGKAAYDKSCKSCHGADGAPNAAVAKMMKVEMRHLGSKEVQALGEAKWTEIMLKGVGKMKGISSVNDKLAADIYAHTKSFKQ